ncbi:Hypothetical protein, putative [Bodo saltans]|uniref:GOLD domain-containing protein n=1 Tax=Bodo saltans TaxID=75058 RepID=A0A0S4JHW2_BODSA|nr:Hypothetical protein, putative [Bodo saltans]|eukprot:CUG89875.1 Hypothetical protein, putative [Bodo saltans]
MACLSLVVRLPLSSLPLGSRDMFGTHIICLAILFTSSSVYMTAAVKTKIDAKKIECFSLDVEAGASVAFDFKVLHGGEKDLDVFMTAISIEEIDGTDAGNSKHQISSLSHTTNTRIIEEWKKASEGRATYTAPSAHTNGHGLPTKVGVCFNNKMSSWTPKWYSFELFSDPAEPVAQEKETLASAETELEHALHKEGNNLFSVRTMMTRLKNSEEEHRNKVESTNEWMLYGTIVNGVLLMGLSVFQFWYLKKFLSVRHVSMRL